jgi:hypothetical protein
MNAEHSEEDVSLQSAESESSVAAVVNSPTPNSSATTPSRVRKSVQIVERGRSSHTTSDNDDADDDDDDHNHESNEQEGDELFAAVPVQVSVAPMTVDAALDETKSFFQIPDHEASTKFHQQDEMSGGGGDVPHVHDSASTTKRSTSGRAKRFFWLTLTALGVIFGDIGTSPLYAFSASLNDITPDSCHKIEPETATSSMMTMMTMAAETTVACEWPAVVDDALGVMSLLIWALTLVVTLQYVVVVLSLDYNGEGGHMALAAQIFESKAKPFWKALTLWVAATGAGFVLGDGTCRPCDFVLHLNSLPLKAA